MKLELGGRVREVHGGRTGTIIWVDSLTPLRYGVEFEEGVFATYSPEDLDPVNNVTASGVETSHAGPEYGASYLMSNPNGSMQYVPPMLSFRDQLARDLLVAAVRSGLALHREDQASSAFELAETFIFEAKRRGGSQ